MCRRATSYAVTSVTLTRDAKGLNRACSRRSLLSDASLCCELTDRCHGWKSHSCIGCASARPHCAAADRVFRVAGPEHCQAVLCPLVQAACLAK